MSKIFIEEDSLTAIGDAIRNKTGNTNLLSVPIGMVNAINNIEINTGILDLRVIKITDSSSASIKDSAFLNRTDLKIVYLPNVSSIANNAFLGCDNLTDIYVPWSNGEIADAPWSASNATIHYDYSE